MVIRALAPELPWIVALPVSVTLWSSSMVLPPVSVMVVPDTVTSSSVSAAFTVTAPLFSATLLPAVPSILLAPATTMVPPSLMVPPMISVPDSVSVVASTCTR